MVRSFARQLLYCEGTVSTIVRLDPSQVLAIEKTLNDDTLKAHLIKTYLISKKW